MRATYDADGTYCDRYTRTNIYPEKTFLGGLYLETIQQMQEIDEAIEEQTSFAEENDPYKAFDERLLNFHTYKDNLMWHIATMEKRSPENEEVLLALIVSAYATHDDYHHKLHIFISGDSAAGKTQKCETVRSFLPQENRIRATSIDGKEVDVAQLSPKALFYGSMNTKKDGKERIPDPLLCANRVIYLDDVAQNDIEMLKKLTNTSGEVPSHVVTNRDNNGIKTMILDGKPTVWCSKVSMLDDDGGQTLSRFYKIECKKELPKVHKHILFYEVDEEQLRMEDRLRKFISDRIKIHCTYNIPREMLERLPIPTTTNRDTIFEKVCLQAIAKINCPRDYDFSKPIVPTEADLQYVIRMFQGKYAENHVKCTSAKAQKILEYITEKEPNPEDMKLGINLPGQTIDALLSTDGIKNHYSTATLKRIIVELEKANYINVYKGMCGKKYFYKSSIIE